MQVTTFVLVLVTAGVLALALVAVVAWVAIVARRARELEARLGSELSKAREELAQVSAQGLRIANQQRATEKQIQQLADRQGRFELRGEGRPFEHAIDMLRAGASRHDLVARLGLSDSEAALLDQLHGTRGSRVTQPPPQA